MPPRRLDIVDEVRSWIGTPWQHQGRLKGRGVDCIGLALAAARAAGDPLVLDLEREPPRYGRFPHNDEMRRFLDTHLDHVTVPAVADFVLIAHRVYPMHLGILTPGKTAGSTPFGLIHALNLPGCSLVVETPFQPALLNIAGYWRLRGID